MLRLNDVRHSVLNGFLAQASPAVDPGVKGRVFGGTFPFSRATQDASYRVEGDPKRTLPAFLFIIIPNQSSCRQLLCCALDRNPLSD